MMKGFDVMIRQTLFMVRDINDENSILGVFDADNIINNLIDIIKLSEDLTTIIDEYYKSNGMDTLENEDYETLDKNMINYIKDRLRHSLYSFDYQYYLLEKITLNMLYI